MQRYARQIILPEIGQEGQERLRQASVLCIGAGGLGAPVLLYLAAAGIGRIGIVDDDVVDITNLQRQVLFREQDKGELKTQAAKHALMALNSDISIVDFTERFCAANAENLFDSFDIVIDGTDNFASKFLINDACVKFSKPLIYASILGFEAQVSVFSALHGPCYRCLYPAPPSDHIPNCAEAGVMGALAGIAGSVQALEAIKILLGYDWCVAKGLQSLLGRLWMLDARTMESRVLALSKNPSCPVCSISPSEIAIHEHQASCSANTKIKTLSAAEALEMREIAIFIDVREAYELSSGKIPKSLHIPLATLLKDEHAMERITPNAKIIVYCQHGIRSLTAASHLAALGFTSVAHMAGGIIRWEGELL